MSWYAPACAYESQVGVFSRFQKMFHVLMLVLLALLFKISEGEM